MKLTQRVVEPQENEEGEEREKPDDVFNKDNNDKIYKSFLYIL
jgi:hypothetical protein